MLLSGRSVLQPLRDCIQPFSDGRSTWHAAASVHTYNSDANVSKQQKYTIDLYREIERVSCRHHPPFNRTRVQIAALEAR
jgi:hypothetical protein